MGIPAFFRWLTDKYDTVIGKTDNSINIDNLYFDFNGLIHPCCHPNDKEAPKTEDDMILEIIRYFEMIVDIIKPKNLIYVAIDGVAPRAKMNQQRMRRYKSIKEKLITFDLKKKHNILHKSEWDSNAITPGTKFMYDLNQRLHTYFEQYSKNHDIQVIFSDCNVPSEGEHKIMNYIRAHNDDYSHCIYGLDADLIILSMLLEKEDIYLLREAQNFNRKAPKDTFNYLHIDRFIECFKMEFDEKDTLRIIKDFSFLTFLLGNDFISNLPTLSIRYGGLDMVIEEYKNLGEYITDDEYVNLDLLKQLLIKLVETEECTFDADYKKRIHFNTPYDKELYDINYMKDKEDGIDIGVEGWQQRYNDHSFKYIDMKDVIYEYFKTLKWIWLYYVKGCVSWTHYYPYHVSPTISDIIKYIDEIDYDSITFDDSIPHKPLEQLISVLPPKSSDLLPVNYRNLIHDDDSPLISYYPIDFEVDYLGKTFYWECHSLLPFIDDGRLKHVLKDVKLNESEMLRNGENSVKVYK